MRPVALCLQRPFGQTITLAAAIFGLLLGMSEAFSRTDLVLLQLTAPKMGSSHYEFGEKLAKLEALSNREGKINCIILGNSMVDLGVDPDVIANTVDKQVGEKIQCFNFAIDGIPASAAGPLSQILVKEFEPRLLIYGTDARDYAVPADAKDATVILNSNWIRYRLGTFTLDGWLLQHSYLYRYANHFAQLLRFDFKYTLRSQSKSRFTRYGFTPDNSSSIQVNIPPDPSDDAFQVKYYFKLLSDYKMRSENITGLEQIINLNGPNVKVVILEMPVPDTYFYFFGKRSHGYQEFINRLSVLTETNKVPFWQTTRLHMIPDSGWVDYSHMNTEGAVIFSEWLGQRLTEMINHGELANLNTPAEQ